MNRLKSWIAIAALTTLAGTSQASLVSLGNGTVLDTTTDLVWLQDWNLNGGQTWSAQVAWANDLTFAGHSDWVLPGVGDFTTLYNEVGNLSQVDVFTQVQDTFYWTRESYNSDNAAAFFPTSGSVAPFYYGQAANFAVAVRTATAADLALVPEPQTLAMVLLGLSAAVVARRRPQR